MSEPEDANEEAAFEAEWRNLPVVRLRAEFSLVEPLMTHTLNGPMLRGAFGTALRTMHGKGGLYERLFDEGSIGGRVRPYRVRAALSRQTVWPEGSLLPFEIDLFGEAAFWASDLLPSLVVMAHHGFGERRSSARLHAVEQLLPSGPVRLVARGLAEAKRFRRHTVGEHLPDTAGGVRFVGPVRIASRGKAVAPTLGEILADTTRRLRALTGQPNAHQEATNPAHRWSGVEVIREERLSRREGAQKLSGVIGELVPGSEPTDRQARLLSAACVVGVGRHTSLGFGDCRPLSRETRVAW